MEIKLDNMSDVRSIVNSLFNITATKIPLGKRGKIFKMLLP